MQFALLCDSDLSDIRMARLNGRCWLICSMQQPWELNASLYHM